MAIHSYTHSYSTTMGNTIVFNIHVGDESTDNFDFPGMYAVFDYKPSIYVQKSFFLTNGDSLPDKENFYINGTVEPPTAIAYTTNLNLNLTFEYLDIKISGAPITDSLNVTITLPEIPVTNIVYHRIYASGIETAPLSSKNYTNNVGQSIIKDERYGADKIPTGFELSLFSEKTIEHEESEKYSFNDNSVTIPQYLTPMTLNYWYTPKVYNITYFNINEEDVNPNPSTYTIMDKIILQNPTRDGYKFIGWSLQYQANPETIMTDTINSTELDSKDISRMTSYSAIETLVAGRTYGDLLITAYWVKEGHQNIYLCDNGDIYANDFIVYPTDKVFFDSDGNIFAACFESSDKIMFDNHGQVFGTIIRGEPEM